jgi:hypothetical protein
MRKAESPVPEHVAAHVMGSRLVADQRAADQLPTLSNLVVEVVGLTATLGEIESGQRIPADMRVPDDRGPDHDELTR